jgi:hypothetical protein
MSRRIKRKGKPDIVVSSAEEHVRCKLCEKIAECRPYGPRGEQICYQCAMKDPAGTERQMARVLFGETIQ